MAESLEALQENFTCSICLEIFREPVTLLCKHSYCRECLQAFADKSKEVSQCNESGDVVISCPQCRAATHLGREGVAGLSVNADIEECSTKFDSAKRPKEASLLCSLCDNDEKGEAVKFCPTCCFLYCEECLSALHPMKGAMRQHSLISKEEYLSKIRGHDPKLEFVKPTPSCDIHKKTFTIYCVTCRSVLCTGCLTDHNEHIMGEISAAREKVKVPFVKNTKKCEKFQHDLKKSVANLKDLEAEIQRHEGLQKAEIFKAYNKALEAMNTWKNNSLMELEKRHSDWYRQCQVALKDLEMKIEEIQRTMITSDDLASSRDVVFLQGIKQLTISIDNQLPEIRNSLKTQEDVITKLQAALELDGVVSRQLTLKEISEKEVREPVLKFTKTSHTDLKISDNGSLIEADSLNDGVWYTAWTGVRLQSGHITWGLEITVTRLTPGYDCYCMLGVVREGCDLWSICGITSWCIVMEYCVNKVKCCIPYKCPGDVTSCYDQYIPHTGPHRLGFSLNCNKRTLTVTDIDNNQVVATVRHIDLSEPVIPAVGFYSGYKYSASARLFHWDSLTPEK